MILFVWSIYILISGKYQISKKMGIKGKIARLWGIFNLLVALGLVGSVIPIQNIAVSIIIQLVIIAAAPFLAVAIHGNHFKEEIKETSKETARTPDKVE